MAAQSYILPRLSSLQTHVELSNDYRYVHSIVISHSSVNFLIPPGNIPAISTSIEMLLCEMCHVYLTILCLLQAVVADLKAACKAKDEKLLQLPLVVDKLKQVEVSAM